MSTLKTTVNDASAEEFSQSIEHPTKREDAFTLLELYKEITGYPAKMWGSSIIGFGSYHYKSERSSQEGDWPLDAFSPRKQNLTLYMTLGFENYHDLLARLGKHKISKGCLYINKLRDVDLAILRQLVQQSHKDALHTLTAKTE